MMTSCGSAALTLLIERFTGYPEPLYRLAGHPVEWMGRLLTVLEGQLNRPGGSQSEGRTRGIAALAGLLVPVLAVTWAISALLSQFTVGWMIEALIATMLVAQKSLRDHVTAVAQGLERSVEAGREAVSKIVGRDPGELDESGVSRAALESLAENSSDGVVAPILWYALLGLPGLAVYKAINTADSMVGHKTARHRDFGWAAARLDDLVNLPASRLTGLLFAAAAHTRFSHVWQALMRDAANHVSPNAGWPETALAAGLEVRLGGARSYEGNRLDLAEMGDGRSDLTRDDIRAGLSLYERAITLLFLAVLVCAIVF